MSAKQLMRLVLVFLGLLVLWGAAALGRRHGMAKAGGESLRLPTVARSAVDSIVLTKSGASVVLARKDSSAWTANGFPAAMPAVPMQTDRIRLESIRFRGRHGASRAERDLPQDFTVTLVKPSGRDW